MSECLHCCRCLSPISAPDPCPHMVEKGSYVFCEVYNSRPEQCRNNDLISMNYVRLVWMFTTKID